jgi:hypothetical protein
MRHQHVSARFGDLMERHQRDDGSTSMALPQSTDDSPQLSARFTAFYTFHLIKINQLINQFH